MKVLYFDCFAGASGDMILGALIGAGVDLPSLLNQLSLLNVSGYEVTSDDVDRSGIRAKHVSVRTNEERDHRHLSSILKIIDGSDLSEGVKHRSTQIFTRLAEAEANVHGIPIEKVHFHEVGALDAIIDVVGASIGFELLGIDRFLSSPLHVGSGFVEMAHGRFPVPPPAVTELLKGVPVYGSDIVGELVTPTGAAIISTVCSAYGALPPMTTTAMGYGAGTREYEKFPNVLRILVGVDESQGNSTTEKLLMLETNIDDMSPQNLGYVMESALRMGALDCFFTPTQMKKNRPGTLVSILCRDEDGDKFHELLFSETTTIGVRSYHVNRRALDRDIKRVSTRYGEIDVKVANIDGRVVNVMPEYEQCRKAAEAAGVPLRTVEDEARAAFSRHSS